MAKTATSTKKMTPLPKSEVLKAIIDCIGR
jgi:hypothetical protein